MGKRYTSRRVGPGIELVPMCPNCRADIYWKLHSGVSGAQGSANCANHQSATRIIYDIDNIITCEWVGIVIRNKDGSVDIFNMDGSPLPHRVIKRSLYA
jgi:hypothetical protein